MKKKLIIGGLLLTLVIGSSVTTYAQGIQITDESNQEVITEEGFEMIIEEILNLKNTHPEYTDEKIFELMNERHQGLERGIVDIWNVLTDSEKKIMYPLSL